MALTVVGWCLPKCFEPRAAAGCLWALLLMKLSKAFPISSSSLFFCFQDRQHGASSAINCRGYSWTCCSDGLLVHFLLFSF